MSRYGRRRFLGSSLAAGVVGACGGSSPGPAPEPSTQGPPPAQERTDPRPVFVATWRWGRTAVDTAAARRGDGGSLLDAVEAGVMAVERDPEVLTVGVGGYPNAEGTVQLDAMIMRGSDLAAGAVGALEGFATPIAVARRVMERTRHVFLVGPGAAAFARDQGFEASELLREPARARWRAWRERGEPGFLRDQDADQADDENHDTVGLVGVAGGEAVAGLSTSGLAFKLPGRVGDSPIVGAGGYADAEVGAAAATGVGEEVIRTAGAYAVVAAMEAGLEPEAACRRVLDKLRRRRGEALGDGQVAFVAVRSDGSFGGAALRPGFEYFVHAGGRTERREVEA